MERTQPLYISIEGENDEYEVLRFLQNKIVWDFLMEPKGYLNDIAHWKFNKKDIHLDDYRQMNQLLGYSLSGFLSLSICYRNGEAEFTEFDEDYALYLEKLPVQVNPQHPEQYIIEDIDSPNFYRENKIFTYVVSEFNENPEKYFNDAKYSLADKRQFAQLLGYTVDEVERRFAKES